MTIDRQCASGLMAIATAAKQIADDGMEIAVGGGVKSISLVQNEHRNQYRAQDPWLLDQRPDLYMTMIETAEIVAERYQVTRDAQDEYALQSQLVLRRHRRRDVSTGRSLRCPRSCGSKTARPARSPEVPVTLEQG